MIQRIMNNIIMFLSAYLLAVLAGTMVAFLSFILQHILQEGFSFSSDDTRDIFYMPLVLLYFAFLLTPLPTLLLYMSAYFIPVTLINYVLLGTVMGLMVAFPASVLVSIPGYLKIWSAKFAWIYLKIFLSICLPASLAGTMVFYKQARSRPK